ncbi:MAG: hypothetical protein LBF22_14190 [Deltaproteobacteria bacterium]|jgi:hypothetical protein|nr:hypothetical protein [Deltaproteobacteria bacterium]
MTVNAMLIISKVNQRSTSYKSTATILKENSEILVDAVTVKSVTNHIGSLVFKHELDKAKARYEVLNSGKMEFTKYKKDDILYIIVNGCKIKTRLQDENIKPIWHETKLGIVYSYTDKCSIKQRRVRIQEDKGSQDGELKDRHQTTKKDYVAFNGSEDIFKILLFNCAIRNGYGLYKRTVLLSDGATWIRNMKDELFADAQLILDFFHLSEKILDFDKIYYHNDKDKYDLWCQDICRKFLESKWENVLKMIQIVEDKLQLKKNKLSTYILNNKNNIDYAAYKKDKLDIISGAIESSNKNVIQRKMEEPEKRWHRK